MQLQIIPLQNSSIIEQDIIVINNSKLFQESSKMSRSKDIVSMGGPFTHKKTQPIILTFEDQITKRQKQRPTLTRKYFPWVRIDEMKKDISKNTYSNKIPWDQLRLFCKNIELQNNNRFFDYNVDVDNNIIIQKIQNITIPERGIVNLYHIFSKTPKEIQYLIMTVQSGLNAGRKPKLSDEGTSGTYFLQNHQKKKIAIFKPHDQQPFTPSNPRGYIGNLGGNGIRKGILSGQSATRQVAAYLLDTNNFHKVPATTYVQFYHPSFNYKQVINQIPILSNLSNDLKTLKTKHGSLQQFVESHDVAGNLGSHQFDVDQVHKIGILDLRILNCDRNQANILCKKVIISQIKTQKQSKRVFMYPIDHGLSFPDNFQIYQYQMVWMSYPQSKQPFSQKSLQFIKNIDPQQDCRTLRQKLGFRQICLRNFKIAQIFLKKMASSGFTLHQIGAKVYRMDDQDDQDDQDQNNQDKKSKDKNKSELQKLVQRAQEIYNLVKQKGIRATVQFQIGLIKMRKQQQQSLSFLEQKRIQSIKIHQVSAQKQQQSSQYLQQKLQQKVAKKLLDRQKLQFKIEQQKALQKIDQQQQKQQHQTQQKPSQQNPSICPSPQQDILPLATIIKKDSIIKQTSLQKLQKFQSVTKSIPKVRNISLPHLKKQPAPKIKKKKRAISPSKKKSTWKKNQTWEDIFFHYFQDLLQEYIKKLKNKKKNQNIAVGRPGRSRLMSQNIDLDQI